MGFHMLITFSRAHEVLLCEREGIANLRERPDSRQLRGRLAMQNGVDSERLRNNTSIDEGAERV
jgi:hypothetical protein